MPRLKILGFIVVFTLIGWSAVGHSSRAQDAATCENLLAQAVQMMRDSCDGLTPGNVCTPSGSTVALGDIDILRTAPFDLNANQWDYALIQLPAGNEPIAMALFGGAAITPMAGTETAMVEPLKASNKSGYNLNMRQGPGTDFEVAGFFGWDNVADVDGRSADGDWLRLQTEAGYAWIAADLVAVEGDVSQLLIVSDGTNPLEQFTLTTPDISAICGAGAAGLLVAHAGQDEVALQVNGANLTFDTATLLLQAQPNTNLEIFVIEGEAAVNADGEQLTARQGETAAVALAGENGLEADAAPLVKPSFPLDTLIGIPMGLVSDESLACTAGMTHEQQNASAFEQPNSDAAVTALLLADAHYPVLGRLADEQAHTWWRLEVGWVREDTVQVVGSCDAVTEVAADTSVTTSANMSTHTGAGAALFSTELVPTSDIIWSADPGQDILSGTCILPPLPVCSHPVAVTANGATLSWRGQEPLPYTLNLSGDNAYTFNGRNNLNNANVTMALTFTSPTTWMMTMTQVFDSDPACTHALYYNAVPR